MQEILVLSCCIIFICFDNLSLFHQSSTSKKAKYFPLEHEIAWCFASYNFLKDLGNPYNFVGKDTDGKISISFGIYGIPESILVNNELTVIKKIIGPIDQVQFEDVLKIIQ